MGGRRRRRRFPIKLALTAAIAVALAITTVVQWIDGRTDTSSQRFIHSETSVYYRYCSEAQNAGAAPLYRGSPGYRPDLDADGDGIACEPYP
nr:excalibur calcium-binding domain-containing protein [Croceicoccus sp. Ery15]